MTLDDLPLFDDPAEPRPGAAPARKCKRHQWCAYLGVDLTPHERCFRCGRARDLVIARRGRSSDRLGKDQERRIERVYGPRKVGEYGDAIDHLGRDFKWQAKASRKAPPAWLARITEPAQRDILPRSILEPMAHMRQLGGTRQPLVIRSYVHQGVPTRDWLFVTSWAWGELHAWPSIYGYVVVPGAAFLDIHGRDTE